MAVTFSLTSTGLTTIDFTDNSTSFYLQEGDYLPVWATPTGDGTIPPYVTETLPVGVNAVTYNSYASWMQNLVAFQKRAAEYWVNSQQAVPVWLNCKADGETSARRAFVKAIHFEFRPWTEALYQECPSSAAPHDLFGTILIERHPYWEDPTPQIFDNATMTAAASVVYDYLIEPGGDVPCRINALAVRSATAAITLERFWMGIRSATLHGADGVTNFKAVWECEDGGLFPDVAIDAAAEVNLASPGGGAGSFIKVTEAAVDWDDGAFHPVVSLNFATAGYAAASYEDGYGRFLCLLRVKCSAGEWEVKTSAGYVAVTTTQPYSDPASITNTSWDYKEVGIWTLGGRNRQAIETAQIVASKDLSQIHVYAKRISGAGTLSLDCLCPIPVDEGFLEITDANVTTLYDVWFGQGPKEDTQVITTQDAASDVIAYITPYEVENFRLPPGDGRIICVYARESTNVFTDQIEFADISVGDSNYTERWVSLAGTE